MQPLLLHFFVRMSDLSLGFFLYFLRISNALSSGAVSQNAIEDALSSPRIDVSQLKETYAAVREQDAEIEQGLDEESSESLLTESEDEE